MKTYNIKIKISGECEVLYDAENEEEVRESFASAGMIIKDGADAYNMIIDDVLEITELSNLDVSKKLEKYIRRDVKNYINKMLNSNSKFSDETIDLIVEDVYRNSNVKETGYYDDSDIEKASNTVLNNTITEKNCNEKDFDSIEYRGMLLNPNESEYYSKFNEEE